MLPAACRGDRDAAAALIEARSADIDEPDGRGMTPLHWACACDEPEVVLPLMPKHLLVYIMDAEWTIKGLPKAGYPLRPAFRSWTRDKAGNLKVLRHGFPLAPDFAGTAHSYTGARQELIIPSRDPPA